MKGVRLSGGRRRVLGSRRGGWDVIWKLCGDVWDGSVRIRC